MIGVSSPNVWTKAQPFHKCVWSGLFPASVLRGLFRQQCLLALLAEHLLSLWGRI